MRACEGVGISYIKLHKFTNFLNLTLKTSLYYPRHMLGAGTTVRAI
jgi:hypothetical protein